jgi:hypothetical protein
VKDQGERESIVILIETEVIQTMMLWRITPKFAVWQWMCRGTFLPLSAAFKNHESDIDLNPLLGNGIIEP